MDLKLILLHMYAEGSLSLIEVSLLILFLEHVECIIYLFGNYKYTIHRKLVKSM